MVVAILSIFVIAGCSTSNSSGGANGVGGTGPTAVNLGTAGNFVIIAKAGISDIPISAITGDMDVSPLTLTGVSGFVPAPAMDASNNFAATTGGGAEVTGKIYAAGGAFTPAAIAIAAAAVADFATAYTDAAGRTNGAGPNLNLGAGTIPIGTSLAPGTYTWGANLSMPTDVILLGGANDTWLFQIGGTFTTAGSVILSGGALPQNIVWQATGATSLGAGKTFNGIILDQTGITLGAGAIVNGRLFGKTAVSLASSTVTHP
jgi:hypothetical protein